MRKIVILITAIAVFLSLTVTAMAAELDSFFPNKSSNLKKLYGGIFLGRAEGKINDTTDTEIIPYHPPFRYAIKQTSKGGYAKVLASGEISPERLKSPDANKGFKREKLC